MMKILVTGGAGYIGSHCCVALIRAGLRPIILDNLSNSHPEIVLRIERITGTRPLFVQNDIRNTRLLDDIFSQHDIAAVMHFAAFKAVGDSLRKPIDYFDNNVGGTLSLLRAMKRSRLRTLVFSSSATVYGKPDRFPIREDDLRCATNPYGRSKLMVEDMLDDLVRAETDWRIARLRYFNPAGAHDSGLIGDDPTEAPSNLMPHMGQVVTGRRRQLSVFGGDYPTRDGTGLRDYIHVMDLADGHLAALDYLRRHDGLLTLNLGTGQNVSVLEMIAAFERASGQRVPYEIVGRRPGDVAESLADPTLAHQLLGWRATRTLEDMCEDAWRWQRAHANGYGNALRQTA